MLSYQNRTSNRYRLGVHDWSRNIEENKTY
jgi:hypothetical protein